MIVQFIKYWKKWRKGILIAPYLPKVLIPKPAEICIPYEYGQPRYRNLIDIANQEYNTENCQELSLALFFLEGNHKKRIGLTKLLLSDTPSDRFEIGFVRRKEGATKNSSVWEEKISNNTEKLLREKIRGIIKDNIIKNSKIDEEDLAIFEVRILIAIKKYGWMPDFRKKEEE